MILEHKAFGHLHPTQFISGRKMEIENMVRKKETMLQNLLIT